MSRPKVDYLLFSPHLGCKLNIISVPLFLQSNLLQEGATSRIASLVDPFLSTCKACGKRIGEDMPAKHRGCSKCPVVRIKHATSTRRKQNEGTLLANDEISEMRRSIRPNTRTLVDNVYCELNEDVDMDSDDDLGQDFQQGYLCVSADPRRVGGPGGEPTIINLKELRTLLRTQQTLEDQTVWLTTAQAGFPVAPDPKPLMTNHPPRVTDSNTRISLTHDSSPPATRMDYY